MLTYFNFSLRSISSVWAHTFQRINQKSLIYPAWWQKKSGQKVCKDMLEQLVNAVIN